MIRSHPYITGTLAGLALSWFVTYPLLAKYVPGGTRNPAYARPVSVDSLDAPGIDMLASACGRCVSPAGQDSLGHPAGPAPSPAASGFVRGQVSPVLSSHQERLTLDMEGSSAGQRPRVRRPGVFRVTAYCPCRICCGRNACGITASGSKAAVVTVAADWSVVPKGTRLDIPGYGRGVVLDTGSAIRGRRLDVFFRRHSEALKWGVRWIRVYVVKP